jgi:uncharacterized Zn-finger protein
MCFFSQIETQELAVENDMDQNIDLQERATSSRRKRTSKIKIELKKHGGKIKPQPEIKKQPIPKTTRKRSAVDNRKRNFKCEICEKTFKCRRDLDRHTLVHTNIRKFECHQCGFRFKRMDHMKDHIMKHLKQNSKPQ